MVTRAQGVRPFGVVVMMLITTGGLLAPRADARTAAGIAASTSDIDNPSSDHSRAAEPEIAPEREEGATDLYGNDVASAVAKYRLDVDGSLYEAHSPQTQLPRLGSPKS